jgi:hypothetical protein
MVARPNVCLLWIFYVSRTLLHAALPLPAAAATMTGTAGQSPLDTAPRRTRRTGTGRAFNELMICLRVASIRCPLKCMTALLHFCSNPTPWRGNCRQSRGGISAQAVVPARRVCQRAMACMSLLLRLNISSRTEWHAAVMTRRRLRRPRTVALSHQAHIPWPIWTACLTSAGRSFRPMYTCMPPFTWRPLPSNENQL